MDRSSSVTVGIAAFLLVFAILSPFIFPEVFGSDFEGFIFGICAFVIFFIIGIVVLIVGLARGGGGRQQQQQQVVVMGAGGVPVPANTTVTTRVKCPTCQHLNPMQARFCTQCATHLGGPNQ